MTLFFEVKYTKVAEYGFDVVDVVDVWILVLKDFLIIDDSVVLCGHVHDGLAW